MVRSKKPPESDSEEEAVANPQEGYSNIVSRTLMTVRKLQSRQVYKNLVTDKWADVVMGDEDLDLG